MSKEKIIEPYQERMLYELKELDERKSKLWKFIGTDENFAKLSEAKQDLIRAQYEAMAAYAVILFARLHQEGFTDNEIVDYLTKENNEEERNINIIKNKLSKDDITSKIKKVVYTVLEDKKTTIANVYLENGFTVRGESACVDPSNYDKEIGEEIALENAVHKIWELEGYLLAEQLYRNGKKE